MFRRDQPGPAVAKVPMCGFVLVCPPC